jgi:hypothetical protein
MQASNACRIQQKLNPPYAPPHILVSAASLYRCCSARFGPSPESQCSLLVPGACPQSCCCCLCRHRGRCGRRRSSCCCNRYGRRVYCWWRWWQRTTSRLRTWNAISARRDGPLCQPRSTKRLRGGAARWICAGDRPEGSAWLGRCDRVLLTPARCADLPPAASAAGQTGRRERAKRRHDAPVAGSDDAEGWRAASL